MSQVISKQNVAPQQGRSGKRPRTTFWVIALMAIVVVLIILLRLFFLTI